MHGKPKNLLCLVGFLAVVALHDTVQAGYVAAEIVDGDRPRSMWQPATGAGSDDAPASRESPRFDRPETITGLLSSGTPGGSMTSSPGGGGPSPNSLAALCPPDGSAASQIEVWMRLHRGSARPRVIKSRQFRPPRFISEMS